MGYLGNTPGESFISFAKQVFTIVNSQTAYTLDFAVVDENELRLVVNNVVQEPGSGKAYTASGTTLTLSAALTNGTDEMYCVFLGKARETVTVPTITRDKLNLISDGSNPSLIAKGTSGVSEGYIQLNCAENSHGIKLKSPPHSAGQSYTLTFPQSITNNTFLKTDGSGNLSFAAAGGTNTPAFLAIKTNVQDCSDNTYTKITFDTEKFDTNNTFASSRFTPGVSGKYYIYANVGGYPVNDVGKDTTIRIYKNGSVMAEHRRGYTNYELQNNGTNTLNISAVIDSDTDDYFEIYWRINTDNNVVARVDYNASLLYTYFGAYKIIE